jgi:diaminohydroxyphosphoribosylaminopyrimidine deaminase / 5-amino-6-(5-phosphoribosylamino)uracil reductase
MAKDIFSSRDRHHMKTALALAEKCRCLTEHDPAVGCVIVKNGRIIGRGCHRRVGSPHAENMALIQAGAAARGATLYINLEPCSHWGNNPPCAEAIIKAGIRRVIASVKDPNPLVNGRGFKKLRAAGVSVKAGLLADEALKINEAFFKFIAGKTPFVTLKIAQSLDGKIATSSGESRWITGPVSRKRVHYLRSINQAIMVGTNTVLKDDPSLTVRLAGAGGQPLRVVLDAAGRIPLSAKVFDGQSPTLLFAGKKFPAGRKKMLAKKGVSVEVVPEKKGGLDLKAVLRGLGARKIASLMVEGGGELVGRFIDDRLADKMVIFLAPLVIGGRKAPLSVAGTGVSALKNAYRLKRINWRQSGPDLLVEGYF